MKNKYKLFLLILVTIIVSGCTANYNIKINLNGSIEETAELTEEKNRLLKNFSEEKFEDYVTDYIKINEFEDKIDKYKIFINDKAGVNVNNAYKDIYEFADTSPAINYVFKKVRVKEQNNIVKIESVESGYEIVYRDNDGELNYTNSYISLSLPYQVISTNANTIDEETNTYTWKLDEEFEGIEIEYNTKKYFSYDIFKLKDYATIENYFEILLLLIIILLVCVIFILGIKLLIRERNNSE